MQKIKTYALQAWYSKFARNVAVIVSGTAAAQVIVLASTPFVTRLYGPEAFGVLGTFNAILAIIAPIGALSYPIAIVLPKEDESAKGLIYLSLKIGIAMSIFMAFIILVAGEKIILFFNIELVGKLIWFLPLAMLFSVLLAVTTRWVVRNQLFRLKAKVTVGYALLESLSKVGIGLFAPFAGVLIVIVTVGRVIHSLLFYLGFKDVKNLNRDKKKVSAQDKKGLTECELIKEYGDFAYFRTPQVVLSAASLSIPVLMLTTLFGPAVAGFYTLGKMVLGAPIQLLGQSVGIVFYPHFNEAILKGHPGSSLLIRATGSLAAIGFIPFGLVFLFGPWLFSLVFGGEWRVAGEFASWMALWLFVDFINRPSVSAIAVLRFQGIYLIYEILSTIIRVMALYIGYYAFGTALSAVIAFSLISAILNFILIIAIFLASKRKDKKIDIFKG